MIGLCTVHGACGSRRAVAIAAATTTAATTPTRLIRLKKCRQHLMWQSKHAILIRGSTDAVVVHDKT